MAAKITCFTLLTICLLGSSIGAPADARELMQTPTNLAPQQAQPIFFKMEEHKAEQQFVFTFGLSFSALGQSWHKAVNGVEMSFHQFGLSVEKFCRDLDGRFKTNDGQSRAMPIPAAHPQPLAADQQSSAHLHYPRAVRIKTIAER